MASAYYRMVVSFIVIDDFNPYPDLLYGQGTDKASIVSEAYLDWMYGKESVEHGHPCEARQNAEKQISGMSVEQIIEYAEGQGVAITTLTLTSDML